MKAFVTLSLNLLNSQLWACGLGVLEQHLGILAHVGLGVVAGDVMPSENEINWM